MKVLHVLNTNKFSGAENVVCQIIGMMKNADNIEMAYCSPDGPIRDTLKKRNISFIPMKKLSRKELGRVVDQYKPDIIHAHDFRASIISTCFCGKAKVISHLHNNSPWLKSYGLKSFLYGYTCKKYSRIITVSKSVFDEFVFGSKFSNRLTVIGNPINTKDIVDRSGEYDFNEQFDIGFCGRLTEQKNPFEFLNVIYDIKKHNKDIRIAMIGDGELRPQVEEEIKRLSLDENIKMFGFVHNPYPIMKNFRTFCLTSKWEGFGLVAVESLALGVPVVCSNVGGLPTIVNDSCGKICTSHEDYVTEIIRLQNDSYYITKSANSIERAKQLDNYAWYQQCLMDIYLSIFTGRIEDK